MDAITFTDACANFSEIMRRVNDDHAPVLVTNQGKSGKAVVIMSLDDYNALEETAYLLRSPRNAARLMRSVEQLRAGRGVPRQLSENDGD
jgi:antitoxin YefM